MGKSRARRFLEKARREGNALFAQVRGDNALYRCLRETLLRCGPFETDAALHSVFAAPALQPWQDQLPEASNDLERVEATIAFLHRWEERRGEKPLVLLLEELSQRLDPDESCHTELKELAAAVDRGELTLPQRHLRRWAFVTLAGVLALLLLLELPPFQQRPVWAPLGFPGKDGAVLEMVGGRLVAGANNTDEGCGWEEQGLWFHDEEGRWHASSVGEPGSDPLCILWWPPPSLSDILALEGWAEDPDVVYALTSHSGILRSEDGGQHYAPYLDLPDSFFKSTTEQRGELPELLVVSGRQQPVFWVAGEGEGLFVHENGAWRRLDGERCQGLPPVDVQALLVEGDRLLLGSEGEGLWLSEDGGQTCRQVLDPSGFFLFRGLADASVGHERYLALVYDSSLNQSDDPWKLLLLCPRVGSCTGETWRADPTPLWQASALIDDLLVQSDGNGGLEWYLVSGRGRVWQGDLMRNWERLPAVPLCFLYCDASLAPAGPGKAPFLLTSNFIDSRVYTYSDGPWWRRWVP